MRNNKTFILLFLIAMSALIVFIYLKSSKRLRDDVSTQQNSVTQFLGTWKVTSVKEDGNELVSDENRAVMKFAIDGTCSASGGCNEMMSCQYEIYSNSKLSISIGGTKKMCSPDIVEYWDLNNVTSYNFIDANLRLYYEKENGVNGSFNLGKLTQ